MGRSVLTLGEKLKPKTFNFLLGTNDDLTQCEIENESSKHKFFSEHELNKINFQQIRTP